MAHQERLHAHGVEARATRGVQVGIGHVVHGEENLKGSVVVDAHHVVKGVAVDVAGVDLLKVARADLDAGAVGKVTIRAGCGWPYHVAIQL